PEGRDHLPALGEAAVRDPGGRPSAEARDAARRARAHHGEDGAPHDGDRRQRHLRGVDAGAARRGAAGGPVRAGGLERENLESASGQNGMSSSVIGSDAVSGPGACDAMSSMPPPRDAPPRPPPPPPPSRTIRSPRISVV